MAIVIDHSIVPSQDKEKAAEFYAEIFGLEDMGEQLGTPFHALRINESSILFFENSSDPDSPWARGIHHYAFAMDPERFQQVFSRIQTAGIPYEDNSAKPANMKGPGTAPGAKGRGKSVYFKDPSANLLEIRTY